MTHNVRAINLYMRCGFEWRACAGPLSKWMARTVGEYYMGLMVG